MSDLVCVFFFLFKPVIVLWGLAIFPTHSLCECHVLLAGRWLSQNLVNSEQLCPKLNVNVSFVSFKWQK